MKNELEYNSIFSVTFHCCIC